MDSKCSEEASSDVIISWCVLFDHGAEKSKLPHHLTVPVCVIKNEDVKETLVKVWMMRMGNVCGREDDLLLAVMDD